MFFTIKSKVKGNSVYIFLSLHFSLLIPCSVLYYLLLHSPLVQLYSQTSLDANYLPCCPFNSELHPSFLALSNPSVTDLEENNVSESLEEKPSPFL